jgi:hypothetical protein
MGARTGKAFGAFLPELLALGLLALAFGQARSVTSDLVWPASSIQYREMASAQTVLDQGFGADFAYRGETPWYNPLSGWIVAAGSVVSGRSPREVIARCGPLVNLVAPVALYALVATLVDRWTALAAAASHLFVTANAFGFWEAASYSPWFAPENYGQGLLYLALLLLVRAERQPGFARYAGCGAGLGLTFLAHTAPALILGTMLVLLAVRRTRQERSSRPLALLVWTLAIAVLTSLPLVAAVAGHYHLAVLNPYPSEAPSTTMDLGDRLGLLVKLCTRSPLLPAIAAIAAYFVPRRESAEGRVVLAWSVTALAFLAYSDLRAVEHHFGFALPAIVPSFHFLFNAMALVSVGFGIALVATARALARRLAPRAPSAAGLPWAEELAIAVLTVACVAAAWGPHSERYDATEQRKEALDFARVIPGDALDWIRGRTASDDVFLSTDEVSLYVVCPAGRKVVCTNRYFSNPYVDWAARDRDRARLYAYIRAGDLDGFDKLATRYAVAYVVASDGLEGFLRHEAGMPPHGAPLLTRAEMAGRSGFETVFLGQGIGIYRRRPVGLAAGRAVRSDKGIAPRSRARPVRARRDPPLSVFSRNVWCRSLNPGDPVTLRRGCDPYLSSGDVAEMDRDLQGPGHGEAAD